jgi:VWFA-related protein
MRRLRMSGRLIGVGLLGAAALVPVLGAQTGQTPVFRSAANAVSREVIVRDAGGRFVPGLSRADFRVLEDGAEQSIEWFTLVQGGRVIEDAPPAPARLAEGLILPKAAMPAPPAKIWIVLIDDLHLEAADTPRLRAILRQIDDVIVRDEDLVAIVSTGYSSIATNLAYDIGGARLREAASRVMGSGPSPQQIIAMPTGANGLSELRYQAHVAFSTVHDLLEQARAIPNRRKAILYVSGGYHFDPLAESRLQAEQERWSVPRRDGSGGKDSLVDPFARQGRQFSEADLIAEIAELIRGANRANVAFHTIDPRGLDAGPPTDGHISPLEWRETHGRRIDSLRVLADQTGGVAVVNTNEFTDAFRRIADDMSDYYVIGYTSTNTDPTRRVRRVEIRLPSRPNLSLRYEARYAIGAR